MRMNSTSFGSLRGNSQMRDVSPAAVPGGVETIAIGAPVQVMPADGGAIRTEIITPESLTDAQLLQRHVDEETTKEVTKLEKESFDKDVTNAIAIHMANDEFDQAIELAKQAEKDAQAHGWKYDKMPLVIPEPTTAQNATIQGLGWGLPRPSIPRPSIPRPPSPPAVSLPRPPLPHLPKPPTPEQIRATLVQQAKVIRDRQLSIIQKMTPPQLKELRAKIYNDAKAKAKKFNKYTQGALLPHGLQSKEARLTRIGKTHNSKTFMTIVNVILTYISGGAWGLVIKAVSDYAVKVRQERLKKQLEEQAAAQDAAEAAQEARIKSMEDQAAAIRAKMATPQQVAASSKKNVIPLVIAAGVLSLPFIL